MKCLNISRVPFLVLVTALGLTTGALAADTPASGAAIPTSTTSSPPKPAQGEVGDVTIKGERKEKLQIGKLDPPAAFNLEDIQNFPEERLQPVLNNPLIFEEGRDFSAMIDFQDEQFYHPWLPEIARAPFLTMKTAVDKTPKDWTFSIIDQAGAPVAKMDGKGAPPASLPWSGEDSVRGHIAVDTVYIPQLATTDKDGYHHTYMGQPVQFASLMYKEGGKTVIELSSKRLFQEKKSDFSKEAFVLLNKVCDAIREEGRVPFTIQPYDSDSELAQSRAQALVKYFSQKLYIPESQMTSSNPKAADKRGAAMAIISNVVGSGGSGS